MPEAMAESLFNKQEYASELERWLQTRANDLDRERHERCLGLLQQADSNLCTRPSTSLRFKAAQTSKPVARSSSASAAGGTRPQQRRSSTAAEGWHYNSTLHGYFANKTATDGSSSADSGKQTAAADSSAAKRRPQTAGLLLQPNASSMRPRIPIELRIMRPATATAKAGSSTSQTAAAVGCGDQEEGDPLAVTTMKASYGLKDLYPELWKNTVPICRPDAAPNKNFISEWGESLKQGAEEAWQPYLATTYQVTNDHVYAKSDDHKVRREQALANWVAKQKLYSEDMMTPEVAEAIQQLLSQPPDAGGISGAAAKELIEWLRQMNGVLQPDRTKPFSHSIHRPQYSVEDVETTQIMKEQTRIRTMGFPKPVAVKGFKTATLTAKTAAAEAAAASSSGEGATVGRTAGKKVDKRTTVETQKSSVPLKWACSDTQPAISAYNQAFRGQGSHAQQMEKVVFKDCNVGLGAVNQHIYPSSGNVFPVPLSYISATTGAADTKSPNDNTLMMSTNMLAYQDRDPEEAARAVAAAAEQTAVAKSARNKSDTPLGKGGVQLGTSAQWSSSYNADYIARRADLSSNHAMAAAVSGMFNGPTISWGRIAGKQPTQLSPAAAAAAAVAAGCTIRVAPNGIGK